MTPIQAFGRTALADLELGGEEISAGDFLVMLYASGNRDEAVFGPTAGQLDVRRPVTPTHVAFGFGEHLCLGAALARLEARIFFEELLGRYPTYAIGARWCTSNRLWYAARPECRSCLLRDAVITGHQIQHPGLATESGAPWIELHPRPRRHPKVTSF